MLLKKIQMQDLKWLSLNNNRILNFNKDHTIHILQTSKKTKMISFLISNPTPKSNKPSFKTMRDQVTKELVPNQAKIVESTILLTLKLWPNLSSKKKE